MGWTMVTSPRTSKESASERMVAPCSCEPTAQAREVDESTRYNTRPWMPLVIQVLPLAKSPYRTDKGRVASQKVSLTLSGCIRL